MAVSGGPAAKTETGTEGAGEARRSRKLYVSWAAALALLVLLGIFCRVAVPLIHLHMVVADVYCAEKDATFVARLGGARPAREKLRRSLYLSDWMAPDKSKVAYLLRNCPEGEKTLVEVLRDPGAPLEVRLHVPVELTATQTGAMDVHEDRSWLVGEFEAALADPDGRVRVAAACGIWNLVFQERQPGRPDAALDVIIAALRDPDPAVREYAGRALFDLTGWLVLGLESLVQFTRAEPALKEALGDEERGVRIWASEALKNLSRRKVRRFSGTPGDGEKQ